MRCESKTLGIGQTVLLKYALSTFTFEVFLLDTTGWTRQPRESMLCVNVLWMSLTQNRHDKLTYSKHEWSKGNQNWKWASSHQRGKNYTLRVHMTRDFGHKRTWIQRGHQFDFSTTSTTVIWYSRTVTQTEGQWIWNHIFSWKARRLPWIKIYLKSFLPLLVRAALSSSSLSSSKEDLTGKSRSLWALSERPAPLRTKTGNGCILFRLDNQLFERDNIIWLDWMSCQEVNVRNPALKSLSPKGEP